MTGEVKPTQVEVGTHCRQSVQSTSTELLEKVQEALDAGNKAAKAVKPKLWGCQCLWGP